MAEQSTKSGKFADAVKRATGQELTVRDEGLGYELPAVEETMKLIPPGFGDIIRPYTAQEVAVTIAKGDMEWAPRALAFKEGMLVEGILEGRGEDIEIDEVDPVTKTVRTKLVGTWVIRQERTGMRASFLTAAQLDYKLPPFVGSKVQIFVGLMMESKKGHRYRDFLIGGAKLANGETRSFSRKPAVIDVPAGPESAEDLTTQSPAA